MKQFLILAKLELINLFGINVYRHEKDPASKRRKTVVMVAILVIALIFVGYLSATAYGLALLGAGSMIPMIYPLMTSLFILIFGAIKAKATIYREKDATLLASLPLRSTPIAMARLFHAYAENMLLGMVIIVPTFLICGIVGKLGPSFYLNLILTLLILPILPTALVAWFGILITAIISRMRHKVLVETLLALVVVVVTFLFPVLLPKNANLGDAAIKLSNKHLTVEEIKALAGAISAYVTKLETSMPILGTCKSLFIGENAAGLLLYGLLSLILLVLTALFIGRNYFTILAKLFPAREHMEYQMTTMRSENLLTALLRKEARRYFSCGIYVSNTIIGPVLAVVFAIVLGFVDPADLLSNGAAPPDEFNVQNGLPFLIAMTYAVMSITASSISIEGKNWWILQSLPVSMKDILTAKLLFNILFDAPFYVVSEIILLFTVRATLLERLWLIVIPAVIIFFSTSFGLLMNSRLPNFHWESEMQVVKQSASTGFSMLALLFVILPGIGVMLLSGSLVHLATLATALIFGAMAFVSYRLAVRAKL